VWHAELVRPADLRAKYEEILRLRRLHLSPDEPDPRAAMAKLAQEFPGALREVDALPLDDIVARLAALARVADEGAPPAPWMIASARYHALTRGALCAKSWLAGRKDVTEETRDAFTREAGALCWAADAREWTRDLARVAEPPRGRVTDLVFARIAAELGVTEDVARALVFPPRRARAPQE
jgi:hypothetical protein